MPAGCATTMWKLPSDWLADALWYRRCLPWFTKHFARSVLASFVTMRSSSFFLAFCCRLCVCVCHLKMAHNYRHPTPIIIRKIIEQPATRCIRAHCSPMEKERKTSFPTARVNNFCNYLYSFRLMSLVLCSFSPAISLLPFIRFVLLSILLHCFRFLFCSKWRHSLDFVTKTFLWHLWDKRAFFQFSPLASFSLFNFGDVFRFVVCTL